MLHRQTRLMRGLQCFEAVARHGSITRAATELGVTQSAISHQLRILSDQLGEQIIQRSGRGIVLTFAGQRLAAELTEAFKKIEASVTEMVGAGRRTLRLAICSSFAPGWLISRLKDFLVDCPSINLQLRLYTFDPEQTDQVADAFITAQPAKPGFWSLKLIDEMLIAVHAADYDLTNSSQLRLITTELEERHLGADWVDYCKLAGLQLDELHSGEWLQCTHYLLALEMARSGLGMALVPDFLAARDLQEGRLAAFSPTLMPAKRTYHLRIKVSRREEPDLVELANWLRAQTAGFNKAKRRRDEPPRNSRRRSDAAS